MSPPLDPKTLRLLARPTAVESTASIRAQAAQLRAAYFVALFERWRERRRARAELRTLSEREIRDFCHSTTDARQEMNKSFWRA